MLCYANCSFALAMAKKNENYLFYNVKWNRFRLQTKFFSHSPHRQRQSDSRDFSADEHSHYWLRPILFKLNWRPKVVWRGPMLNLSSWAFSVNWVRYSGMSHLIAKLSLRSVGSHSIALRIRVDCNELRRYDDSAKNVLHSTQDLGFFIRSRTHILAIRRNLLTFRSNSAFFHSKRKQITQMRTEFFFLYFAVNH